MIKPNTHSDKYLPTIGPQLHTYSRMDFQYQSILQKEQDPQSNVRIISPTAQAKPVNFQLQVLPSIAASISVRFLKNSFEGPTT